MPGTGTKSLSGQQQSIRLTADGLSFFEGREVILVSGRTTWMPMEQFRSDKVDAIYNKVYSPAEQPNVVRYNVLPTLEVIELWSVPKEQDESLRLEYPGHRWMGVNGVVLERVAMYERRRENGRRLYAYRHDGELFVFDYTNDKHGFDDMHHARLHYANSFWPKDDEEARYFLLGVWRSLGLDAEKDECLLIDCDSLLPLLAPYLRNVSPLRRPMLHLLDNDEVPFDVLCV